MSSYRFSNTVDKKLCRDCKKILQNHNIQSLKDFRKWALKNHPDKGCDTDTFGLVSGCNDEYFGTNKRCDMDSSYSRKPYSAKEKKQRKSPAAKEKKPCKSNQIRNPATGRCVLKTSPLGKKIMKEMGGGSSRRASSRRASPRRESPRRASPPKRTPCKSNQIRNPKTGRCVLKTSPLGKKIMKEMGGSSRRASSRRASSHRASSRRASSRKASSRRASSRRASSPKRTPCNSNQIRNPKTGRCVLKSGKIGQAILKERKK